MTSLKENQESLPSNEVTAVPTQATQSSAMSKLNDTGITWGGHYDSGNQSGNNCLPTGFATGTKQDCHHGRDAKALAGTLDKVGDGQASFDFTKLGSNGAPLSNQKEAWSNSGSESSGTKWRCVKDNHTGLIWEVKTDDDTIHDKDNTYKWGGKTAIGKGHSSAEGTYYSDWDSLVDGSNAGKGLCGFTNWRVPTREELRSIVHYGRTNPSIDKHYFPNTPSSGFWSASPYAAYSGYAWLLNFFYGDDYSISNRNYGNRVRLVRFSQ